MENRAAIVIQTAYRAFLARRAFRALKGLVRLQALVTGHIVRKQATITPQCMQSLVRVQAHARARRVCMALGNQVEHQKFLKEQINENRVKEIEEGWCDSAGSVEEIQNKLLRRQEAAARRERAMAYALMHQRQAGTRHHAMAGDTEPDKNNWELKWLERWMAVRPWENRLLDTNMKDEKAEESLLMAKCRTSSTKIISTLHRNLSSQMVHPLDSEGSNSSSGLSARLLSSSASSAGVEAGKHGMTRSASNRLPQHREDDNLHF